MPKPATGEVLEDERRVAARIEATRLGLDIRYVVTNIARHGRVAL